MKKMSKKDRERFKRTVGAENKAFDAMLALNFEDFKKAAISTFKEIGDELGETIQWTADERMKLAKMIGEARKQDHESLDKDFDALLSRIKRLEQMLYMNVIAHLGHIDPRKPVTNECKEFFAQLLSVDLKTMAGICGKRPDIASEMLL